MKVHEAGPLVDGVQRCIRCDYIISDYRGAMGLEADGPLPRGFAIGALTEVNDADARMKFSGVVQPIHGQPLFFCTDAVAGA